jgi:hypothetical protein
MRIAIEALFNRLANAVGVSTTSSTSGSLTVSKNRSMLYDATVNVCAPGTGAGVAVALPLTAIGADGSGKIV